MYDLGANNVDAVDEDGDTAAMVASYKGDIESVKVLHEIKADLSVCGSFGTVMHRAVDAGHPEMLKVIFIRSHPR